MPRKGHTEEQIVYALRQAEGGKNVSEICRGMGVSQQAFYRVHSTPFPCTPSLPPAVCLRFAPDSFP